MKTRAHHFGVILLSLLSWAERGLALEASSSPELDRPRTDEHPTEEQAAAERHWRAGLELGRRGDWSGALERFRRSWEVFPTRVALFNQALCAERLGRAAEALALYDRVEQEFGPYVSEEEREQIARARRKLHAQVAELVIQGDLSSARIWLDGRPIQAPADGASLRVDAGTHALRIEKAGYDDFVRRVSCRGGERVLVTVELRASASRGDAWPLSVEANIGLMLGPSFGGDATSSCDDSMRFANGDAGPGCSSRSLVYGGLAFGRIGYRLSSRLWVDVALGYTNLRQKLVRRMTGASDGRALSGAAVRDEMRLAGLASGLGVSYQPARVFPLVARLTTGAIFARSQGSVRGTFTDTTAPADDAPSWHLDLVEDVEHFVAPFLAPELRVGFRIGNTTIADAGLALFLLLAPGRTRTGDAFDSEQRRRWPAERDTGEVTLIRLANERGVGAFAAALASIGVRHEF